MFQIFFPRKRQRDIATVQETTPALGFSDIFGAPVSPKQSRERHLVVVLGNCLAEGIVEGCESVRSELRHLDFKAVPIQSSSIDDADVVASLQGCHAAVMQRAWFLDQAKVRLLLPANAKTIMFPHVALRSLWPFDANSGFKDDALAKSDMFRSEDGALASLRLLEPDKKKRIRRYLDPDFPEARRIPRVIAAQERFLAELDDHVDVKIGDFIRRRYRDEQLFYSSGHPSGIIYKYIIQELSTLLGLPSCAEHLRNIDTWRQWSVPVHPAIADLLKLKWANAKTRYDYFTLGSVTWEEWVARYIDVYG